VANGERRFAYSADSNFEQRVAAISAGYHRNGAWRVGGGFAFSMMNLRLVQSASERIATSAELQSLLVTARASGSAFQLRAQAGVQYDRSRWRFGLALRTPAATARRSGTVTLDGVLDAGADSFGASVFDVDAQLDYHVPWEFQGGAAFVTGRFEVEVDVQAYTPIDAYALLTTGQPLLVYGDIGPGAPIVTSRALAGLISAADSVVNVDVGGHVQLFEDRELRLHGGVGSNRSPVAAADTVFTPVDFARWSVGLSGAMGRLRFSIGINHQGGHADDVALRNLLDGDVVRSRVDMGVTGFIYALSFQF
jgi:hypothetical protein